MKCVTGFFFALLLIGLNLSAHAQKHLHTANWISPAFTEDTLRAPVIFQRQLSVNKPVAGATLWITARGIYESSLNGTRMGISEKLTSVFRGKLTTILAGEGCAI
ncbi:MAG: hypothetical protein J0I41_22965 [Filimonas sp.]|nr:hypothetical protein [Filimonas sp.]